ncbi:MAG: hypothetical protein ABWY62_01540 [Acidimicrobiia bacterium]
MTLLVDGRRALLESLVDYAGLFPPTSLPMADAIAEYRAGRAGDHGWMLGRFLCPASRLEELAGLLTASMVAGEAPWRVSVVFDGPMGSDAIAAAGFDRTMTPGASVELVEVRLPREASDGRAADSAEEVVGPVLDTAFTVAADVVPFVEVARGPGVGSAVTAIARVRHRRIRPAGAKLRTGGVTADAFPDPGEVASFVVACRHAGLPFKATAGLHHPVRHRDPGLGVMRHGFLNLLAAAALAAEDADLEDVTAAVADTDPGAFVVGTTGLAWRGRRVAAGSLLAMRHRLFPAYGSCSFDEPVEDLVAMGILE